MRRVFENRLSRRPCPAPAGRGVAYGARGWGKRHSSFCPQPAVQFGLADSADETIGVTIGRRELREKLGEWVAAWSMSPNRRSPSRAAWRLRSLRWAWT